MREPDTAFEVPLSLFSTKVLPEWTDYNGHMSEAFYVLTFGYATDALLEEIGAGREYRERTKSSVYTMEAHVAYLKETAEGDPLRIATHLLDLDHKRAHVFHTMHHAERGELLATEEVLLMHVDVAAGRSTAFAPEILLRLEAIRDAHASLPNPERAGHCMAIKHR